MKYHLIYVDGASNLLISESFETEEELEAYINSIGFYNDNDYKKVYGDLL